MSKHARESIRHTTTNKKKTGLKDYHVRERFYLLENESSEEHVASIFRVEKQAKK
jgi:hypothetical protein